MSNVKKGLAALKQFKQDQEERIAAASRPKANWFSFPDKRTNVATVRFLQELDEDADNYNADRGLGALIIEHLSPNPDFRKQKRASCTADTEGHCYGCERHAEDRKAGWGQKSSLYINVLYSFDEDEAPKVGVLKRNFNSSFVTQLIDEAAEENTITDANFRITRSGDGPTTQLTLKKLSPAKVAPFDDSKAEVFNLEQTVLYNIAYSDQPKYYGSGEEFAAKEEKPEAKKTFEDNEW